jgi:hypothetical protein
VNVISSSAQYAFEKLSLVLIQGEKAMDFVRRMLGFFCDEPVSEKGEEGAKSETPAETPDLSKELSEDAFMALSDKDQATYFEKSLERKEAAAKPVEEEEDEEEDKEEVAEEEETPGDDLEVEEPVDEPAAEEAEEEEATEEVPEVTQKRLTDTQKAFRAARQENAELKKRLDALEAKSATPAPEKKKDEPEELTLATIKPEVLAKAMKEHPVETMRWVTDQQVKQTLKQNEEVQKKAQAETDRATRIATSEQSAIKKFPVLKEILDMGPEKLEKLKETDAGKYAFGQKTAKYFKEFQARGDEDAFLNAAARAYVELSPSMIKDIQRETKRLAEKELVNKKRILGKVSISGNKGAIGAKGTSKQRSLSDDEFMALSPVKQMEYWNQSVDSKQKRS